MGEWLQIATALDLLAWKHLGHDDTRFYEEALVYGPTWIGDDHQSPNWQEKGGGFTGEPKIAIASTYSGIDYWTVQPQQSSDYYDEYIKPTHWMPFPIPPAESLLRQVAEDVKCEKDG